MLSIIYNKEKHTTNKLFKTIRQAEKVGSNSFWYSDTINVQFF